MSSGKTTRNWRTGLTGVALIVVGVALLGVQVSPVFASRLHKSTRNHKNWKACNEKVVPFDSYRQYVPRLVKVSFPVGDRVAEVKRQFERSVQSAMRDVRGVLSEARTEIRAALTDTRFALQEFVRDARVSIRITLRSLPLHRMHKTLEADSPSVRQAHAEASRRQAV